MMLLRILSEQVGHLGDGDERMVIDVVDNTAHLGDLEAVDDEIDNGLLFIGVIAVRVHEGDAGAKLVGERLADALRLVGDDHRGLRLVKALDDEVDRLDAGHVGEDGVQRQHPAAHQRAGNDVENRVVDHHECADGDAKALGECDGKHLHAVNGAAEADGRAAADTGDDAAEDSAQKQVAAGKGGDGFCGQEFGEHG